MDEVRMPYHIVNFWLLDLTASFLVFVSAWYGKIKRRRIQTDEVGDYVITVVKEKKVGEGEETSESLCQGSLRRLFLYTTTGKGETNCETVFCKALELSEAWELPTIFTFKLGPREEHVYLGAGDIIIGCMVSNFSQMFFRSSKYLSATVLTYAIAIALLSQVGDEPYPALVTIVPLCSLQLVLSAILSHKTRSLLSLKCLDSEREREGHDMNILL
ncbi:hypothetical protein pdam_00006784 [Pocillopora damicornis]|uniref:Uncharacterized protein n=1 Tax=Pocillopora damicornis TaxID=46731 RepID=A0A3M6V428_POCDA|nr:hypothetical protein pdam_00006784 [Pocillopora damicornis]